jgi:4-diphosphocytidyl-2-C-methyl-D-erythritol kinase
VRELAPAKINLSLHLGPLRPDGRHELVSVMQSISLADRLELEDAELEEVTCAGVDGPNLAAAALAAFRAATGWDGPPQRLRIDKRIPVAAGMGGGSADAAGALRLLARRSKISDERLLLELAAGLGADVPGQLRPGRVLARGAGEQIERLPDPPPFGVLILPAAHGLSTAAVYREADRLGLPRTAQTLARVDPKASVNDLTPAALSLDPTIADRLAQARAAGAAVTLLCGSGPTVIGLYDSPAAAARAAAALRQSNVAALSAAPVRHNEASE